VAANAENKAAFETRRADLEKSQHDALEKARSRAEKMEGVTVQIVRKVSEEGKLFGSVGTRDVVDALAQIGFEVLKSEIQLSRGPIKEVGDHELLVSLHPEINIKIIVSVIGES
jgi:large subunit ribosomal protein L9